MKNYPAFFSLLLLASACAEPNRVSAPVQTEIIRVRTEPVLKQTVSLPVAASGLVHSTREARLSFKNGGRIEKLLVDAGDRVRKGDVLAELDLTEIDAMLAQAREGAEKAQRDVNRVENLYKDSTATLEQLQNARTGFEVAKKQLEIAGFNRKYAVVTATEDGTVLRRIPNEGEWIAPGMPVFLFHAAGSNSWSVKAGLSSKDWVTIKPGDQAKVVVDAYPGTEFDAIVSETSPVTEPGTGMLSVELILDSSGKTLASGMVAKVEILPQTTMEKTMIPISSVVEANGNTAFLFTLDETSGTAKKISIRAGRVFNDRLIVESGLNNVRNVITTGSRYVRDGSPVIELGKNALAGI